MNYWWADCGSDWKEEMEWITAAVVGSGMMSSRWDYVMRTARSVRLTLIHTLPYLPHASHMGGHLSTLAKCKVDVCAKMHPCTHTLARRGVNHLHHHSPLLLKQLTHSLKDKWCWQKYAVREVLCSSSTVCSCVFVFGVQRRGVSADDWVHIPSCHFITACRQTHYIQHLLPSRTVHWGCACTYVCTCTCTLRCMDASQVYEFSVIYLQLLEFCFGVTWGAI